MNRRTTLEAEFGRALLPLARRWRAGADRTLAALGVSHSSGWVLLHVGRLGDATPQSELADALDMKGSSLVRLIDKLEGDALVTRRPDAVDRRVNRIHLTAAGSALVGQIEAALRLVRRDMLGEFDDESLEVATRVLQRLDRQLANPGGGPDEDRP